jgi:hypothetical protein
MRKTTRSRMATVKKLTLAGWRQFEIAERLDVHLNTVYRAQKKLGLRARQPLSGAQEIQIVENLFTGDGAEKTARRLKLSEHAVRSVMRRFGVRRSPGHKGFRWKPKSPELLRIYDLAFEKYSCREIARVEGAPYTARTRRVIRKMQRTDKTLAAGNLVSMSETADSVASHFVKMASIIQRCLGNEVTESLDLYERARLFAGVCFRYVPQEVVLSLTSEQANKVADVFIGNMAMALKTIAVAERAGARVH